jgi:hypothetical protein
MRITDLFTDEITVKKIQARLPELFYIAELESSRAGRVGMEVGSVRERILIALLIYKFGVENVRTDIPIIAAEVDAYVFGNSLSIKTMTGTMLRSVKLIWTVDAEQAHKFFQTYTPSCDILLAQVNWDFTGGLFFFPKYVQEETLTLIGRDKYMNLPKAGNNPRGVEITTQALNIIASHSDSLSIPIEWHRKLVDFDPYNRWLEYWAKE